MNLADATQPTFVSVFDLFAKTVNYRAQQSGPTYAMAMTIRGMRADELFGSAAQGDRLGVVAADRFETTVGRQPQRYDRVEAQNSSFTVMEWRPAPAVGKAVWFRLVLRGGTQ